MAKSLLNWGGRYVSATGLVYYKNGTATEVSTKYTGDDVSNDQLYQLLFTDVDSTNDNDTGHIITHGLDYTPTYAGSVRGFVPKYKLNTTYTDTWDADKGQANALLFGDAKWRYIKAIDLPIVKYSDLESENYTDENLFSAASTVALVDEKIATAFKANDAMQFKGGITAIDTTNKTITVNNKTVNFTDLNAGDTYRATEAFIFDGIAVEVGDLIIVNKDYTDSTEDPFDSTSFTVVEGNVKGTIENTLNGEKTQTLAFEGGEAFSFYAPTESGTVGNLLFSAGANAAPNWGKITKTNKDAALDSSLQAAIISEITGVTKDGITYKALDGTNTKTIAFANEEYKLSISGNAGSANKVNQALTLKVGTGLDLPETVFDGSVAVESTLNLTPATNKLIGGVIVEGENGRGILEFGNNDKRTISVTENGEIYLDANNIASALGFMPGNTDNSYTYTLVHGDSSHDSSANADVTKNPYIHLMGKKEGETSYSSSGNLQLIGESITISAAAGVFNFSLDAATVTTIGGIKVGKVNSATITGAVSAKADNVENRYYAVETDNNNNAYVYVPWKDESYAFSKFAIKNGNGDPSTIEADVVSDTLTLVGGCGITLTADTDNDSININTNLVGTGHTTITPENDATGAGAVTINSTWRDIYLNNTLVDQNYSIKYVSTGDILVANVDDDTNTTTEVGFCISWWNLDEGKQEYVTPEISTTTAN